MAATNTTPMVRQYRELKAQHPGTLLFFRLGDFYELFFEDAVIGARELQITLTARHKESGDPIPMCGVPHHSAPNYIAKLVRKGYRVAICEQTEDASKTKKLVRREVVRVVTPGTPIDPQLLDPRESVYLAALSAHGNTAGAAFLDISTGEFRATQASGPEAWRLIAADVESYAPRELLFPNALAPLVRAGLDQTHHRTAPLPLTEGGNPTVREGASARAPSLTVGSLTATLTPIDDWLWQIEDCASLLLKQFGVRSLDGYGLTGKDEAICAAGACLRYAQETQRAAAAHIQDIIYFDVVDESVTGMGARLLRAWLLRPSIRRGEVEARHGAVAELHASHIKRDRLRVLLKEVADVERLTGRLNLGSATPRDLVALRRSLDQVPLIHETLASSQSSLLQVLNETADELADVRSLIAAAIEDDPPAKVVEGGVIRDGYSTELDELRSVSRDAKQTIANLEAEERARSGIGSLRIRFNNVFGLVCRQVAAETVRIQATARALACLDALAALAETAVRRRFVLPVMHDGDEIEIVSGRHPVIEVFNDEPFIPNSVYLNNSSDRLLIITGPNMGGKSTVLRQTAIVCILAQMGSFVPAEKARLPLLDRVWTRVGASDDLARGRSTFMVEMTETAAILHSATPRSLVLLDEIGRGTATFDGLSIAWAVAEYLQLSDHRDRTRRRSRLSASPRTRSRFKVLRHRSGAARRHAAFRIGARA
ncbi:MAG: DNA mismatch repair protein MutS [Acidobacteria bacterium]|nr:MAG: DNA mismatch repair protein MutS [Acidobacteriota bacterium]